MSQYNSENRTTKLDKLGEYVSQLEGRIEDLEATVRTVLRENQELKWSAIYNYYTGDVDTLENLYKQD